MGIFDVFQIKKIKAENENLKRAVQWYEANMTPEMRNNATLMENIYRNQSELQNIENQKNAAVLEYKRIQEEITKKRSLLLSMDDDILVQDFALYKPTYQFTKSEEYKKRLDDIRKTQKEMIKDGYAATGNLNWVVNGSNAEGRRFVKNIQKLLLRAFNSECDELIDKVKFSNYDLSVKRLNASFEAIKKLGENLQISITNSYYRSKLDELKLSFEYQQVQQREKEERKEARAQAREAEKLAREIAEQRKKAQKEEAHYKNALATLLRQICSATPEELADLNEKRAEIESHLEDVAKAIKDIDYREANIKAGYVYIISNIGSFGEGVYKIGMTRRLEPAERIDELSDASVPFDFDIHAMIFSDDAPALEAALHREFEDRKVNMVNHRREFFRVSLDEIKDVVRKYYDKTVEFTDVPDAEQYRITQKMTNK